MAATRLRRRARSVDAVVFGYHTGAVLAAQLAFCTRRCVAGIVLHGFRCARPRSAGSASTTLPRDLDVEGLLQPRSSAYYDMHVRQMRADSLSMFDRTRTFSQDMIAGTGFLVQRTTGCGPGPTRNACRASRADAGAGRERDVLREATRAASRVIPGCELLEMPSRSSGGLAADPGRRGRRAGARVRRPTRRRARRLTAPRG
jgi:hypothetical protein